MVLPQNYLEKEDIILQQVIQESVATTFSRELRFPLPVTYLKLVSQVECTDNIIFNESWNKRLASGDCSLCLSQVFELDAAIVSSANDLAYYFPGCAVSSRMDSVGIVFESAVSEILSLTRIEFILPNKFQLSMVFLRGSLWRRERSERCFSWSCRTTRLIIYCLD